MAVGSDIPMEVIFDILQRLPLKSIMRFKSVCKDWCNLMKTHDFIVALEAKVNERGKLFVAYVDCCYLKVIDDIHNPSQPTRLKLPWTRMVRNIGVISYSSRPTFEVGRIVGSCNGLLCLCNSYDSCLIALCNPFTRTITEIIHPFKKPPRASPYGQNEYKSTRHLKVPAIFGFGYDMRHDDYKIVTLNPRGEVTLIYSLRSNSWTMPAQTPSNRKQEFKNRRYADPIKNVHGIYSHNKLHWMTWDFNYAEFCIVCFDLSSEEWDELPLPSHALRYSHDEVDLGVLDGCLCLFIMHWHPSAYSDWVFDTWVMNRYGVQSSWTKLSTVKYQVGIRSIRKPTMGHRSLAYSKSDGGHENMLFSKRDGLFWHDLENDTNIIFQLDPLESCCGFWPCAKSLVSIPESNSMMSSNVVEKRERLASREGDCGS